MDENPRGPHYPNYTFNVRSYLKEVAKAPKSGPSCVNLSYSRGAKTELGPRLGPEATDEELVRNYWRWRKGPAKWRRGFELYRIGNRREKKRVMIELGHVLFCGGERERAREHGDEEIGSGNLGVRVPTFSGEKVI